MAWIDGSPEGGAKVMPDQVPVLPLKAMHTGVAPAWWPPAPGWWLVTAVVIVLVAGVAYWALRRHRYRVALERWFDAELAGATSTQDQAAVISALLRRAARRIDPQADRLQSIEWLRFLDVGMQPPVFEQRLGVLLTEGVYQREMDAASLDALRMAARRRFLSWMGAR